MAWPYYFLDLTDLQKQDRRDLLDRYATLAQLSALVPLLAIRLYLFLSWLYRRRGGLSPGSPGRKERFPQLAGLARVRSIWRMFSWWCGDPVGIGPFYLGLRAEVLLAAGWLVWLLVLCILQTGDDYLHLTKRFGIVAASQLPLHYLLAMKSPYSPLQLLTGRSHETLNIFHQLFGRVIMVLLYLHASFYLNFYIQKGLLSTKTQELYVICGILAITTLTVIGTTALAPVRRWSYRIFYAIHVTLAAALMPVLFFHVTHIRPYLYEAAAIYGVNVLLRTLHAKRIMGYLKLAANTNLVEITIPVSASSRTGPFLHWQPGQHAYPSLVDTPSRRTFRSNPFSIASIPSMDGQLRFVARILDGNTAHLARAASASKLTQHLVIEGPYGISTHSHELLQYDRVLFLAGGIGGTFIAPLYRQLLSDLSPSKGSYRRQKVKFVWIAKRVEDVTWAFLEDTKEREGFVERLRVYLTGSSLSDNPDGFNINRQTQSRFEEDDGIELEERKDLLGEGPGLSDNDGSGMSIRVGRPDVKQLVVEIFSHGSHERIAVFVCGLKTLSRNVRREVRRWGMKGREIYYWEEEFAL